MSDTAPSSPKNCSDEPFKDWIGVLIAAVAVLAAIVAFLQTDAGGRSATAYRQARRFNTAALGQKESGQSAIGYSLYSAQVWYELGALARAAEERGDLAAAQRYLAVRERVTSLSPFLQPPYNLDLARFEADTYLVQATELAERAALASAQGDAWNAKSDTYVIHLTLLAIALALYGLSTSVSRRARGPFIGVGSAIVVATVAWVLVTALGAVPTLPDGAIRAYARGVGLAYQGQTEAAIEAFDEALAQAPAYASALYGRGNAHYAQKNYAAAVADYRATQAAGRQDAAVAWNLGWNEYLLGHWEAAIHADRQALELDATLFPVRLNLGLALLASGQVEAAQEEYALAMAQASEEVAAALAGGQQVPVSSWYYLDSGARDLEGLLDLLAGRERPWTQAPPAAAVVRDERVQAAGWELLYRLKGLSVALEQSGRPPADVVRARVSPFRFGTVWLNVAEGALPRTPFEAGVPLDAVRRPYFPYGDAFSGESQVRLAALESLPITQTAFPYDTASVVVYFDYEGMADGQEVVWKVYVNGVEDLSLRRVERWALGPAGQAEKGFSFVFAQDGEYRVEMYVEGHLVQWGTFMIEPPLGP